MVKLDKIYTKTGDKGSTRLSTGEPVDKWHPRVAAYGKVDEVNAALGVCALEASGNVLEAVRRIQNDLFDLGADLATPDRGKKLEWEPLRIVEAQVERIESEIDAMNAYIAEQDVKVLKDVNPTVTPSSMRHEVMTPSDKCVVEYRRYLSRWDAKGWRIDHEKVEAARGKHVYAIPSPRRRLEKGWVFDAVPLVEPKQGSQVEAAE